MPSAGHKDGGAKNSAHRELGILIQRSRAGFEPFRACDRSEGVLLHRTSVLKRLLTLSNRFLFEHPHVPGESQPVLPIPLPLNVVPVTKPISSASDPTVDQ